MYSNKEKTTLEGFCELSMQDKPMSLDAQEATIRRWLNVFEGILSQSEFSENDERCIVETIDNLQGSCCRDIAREDICREIRKKYDNYSLSPKYDKMKVFLDCKKKAK